VEARRTSDADVAPFSITATVLGATISPNPDVVASATIGTPQERSYTVSNHLADFTGRLVGGGSLASTQAQRPTVAHLGQSSFDVTLPEGVSSYSIRTSNSSVPTADIDLFVFRCNPTCVQVGAGTTATSNELVTLTNPAASLYRIVLDGFNVPGGSAEVDLVDSWISSALGSLTSSDTNASHPSGTSFGANATLTVLGQPGAGRTITGTLSVQTDANVVLGTASVVVESVTE
jgi:hypothetical protein